MKPIILKASKDGVVTPIVFQRRGYRGPLRDYLEGNIESLKDARVVQRQCTKSGEATFLID